MRENGEFNMKRNFYLVQAGCLYGNTYYLPYAVGMLAAFAMNDKAVGDNYDLKRIIYKLEDIDDSISSLDNPVLVGLSNSIWNYDFNLEYAQKLKEKFPNCTIVFGGHQVPPTTELLQKYDFVDILIYGKGEEAFRDILLNLIGLKELSEISNIAYRDNNQDIKVTSSNKITISDYPSPYLDGIFDDILKDKEYKFSCVLETNRGCPYNCLYCDWGELNTKIRFFPLQKVFSELEWMSENKIEFVYCVDSNFGISERDLLIAQKLVELKEKTGYPNRLQVSYAKESPERVFLLNKMLSEHGIGKGATISLQSLSPDVLKIIGRKNISKEEYINQVVRYRQNNIPTYTELILGLPGETLDSFCVGLCELLEMGQHSSVSTYYCELLPNSSLNNPDILKKYRIKTISSVLNQYHCQEMDGVLSGHSSIVISTYSMSESDWIKSNIFSFCVQSFHHFGLLQCIAMYIHEEYNVSYFKFYSAILSFIQKDTKYCKSVFSVIQEQLNYFVQGKGKLTYQNDLFGRITFPFEEAVFLLCLHNENAFFQELYPFLNSFIRDEYLLNDLIEYQKSVVLKPLTAEFEKTFSYDYKSYFDSIMLKMKASLKKKNITFKFYSPYTTSTWEEYAREIIWYGRRNGRMMFSSKPNTIIEKE